MFEGTRADATQADARLTLLIYADDSAIRERMRMAIGRRPAPDLPSVDYLEASTAEEVIAVADAGEAEAFILDAEAWPAGGMGLCTQMKNEVEDCPPVAVVVARPADRWLAAASHADAVLSHPLDPVEAARVAADLLRQRIAAAAS